MVRDRGLKILLPFPPSVNGAYAGGKTQRYKSKRYKAWEKSLPDLRDLLFSAINYPVGIQYILYMPDKRLRDITNYVKLVEDYLVKQGVIEDDNYNIIQCVVIKFGGIDKENPRVEIEIRKIK